MCFNASFVHIYMAHTKEKETRETAHVQRAMWKYREQMQNNTNTSKRISLAIICVDIKFNRSILLNNCRLEKKVEMLNRGLDMYVRGWNHVWTFYKLKKFLRLMLNNGKLQNRQLQALVRNCLAHCNDQ